MVKGMRANKKGTVAKYKIFTKLLNTKERYIDELIAFSPTISLLSSVFFVVLNIFPK